MGDEWLEIDFGVEVTLTKVTLALGPSGDDYPRTYATRFSSSPMNAGAPVLVSGAGAANVDTVMDFPKGTVGRYLRISQGGKSGSKYWSVAEIQVACAD